MTKPRIAFAAVVALMLVSSALAANFLLTKTGETTNTITFSYPKQVGADGYRYYAPGQISGETCSGTRVSRTLDPARTSVRFAKVTSGQYCVEAIVLTPIGAAQYPSESPPPPIDTTPPVVSITSPVNGSTVSGTVNQTVVATDNIGVVRVEFLRDGVLYGQDTNSPYSTSFNTTTVANGAHTFGAKAFDAAGNTGVATNVTVTVGNAAVAQCVDGIDNDSDGKIDYPNDPGCLSVTDNDEIDGPPPTGNVFLSPAGSDANNCTQSAPCRSMQRGFQVASPGQTVSMAAGAYPQQTLADAQKQVMFKAAGTVTITGQLEIRCTTGITVDGVSAKNLLVAAGNRTLVVKNSQFGGGTYTAGVEDDPVVIGNVGSCSGGATSDGVTLDNVRVHDYFWQQNTGSAHTDCLQFYGGSVNVTIRNSLFERCAESFIGAFPDFGDIRNTVVEDTVFRDLWTNTGKGTFFAMQWGCVGHSGVGTGITFRRTTWSPGVPVPIRTDCQNFLVENNTFQTGPGQFACDDWDGRWGGTVVWRNNTFLNGNGCTT